MKVGDIVFQQLDSALLEKYMGDRSLLVCSAGEVVQELFRELDEVTNNELNWGKCRKVQKCLFFKCGKALFKSIIKLNMMTCS